MRRRAVSKIPQQPEDISSGTERVRKAQIVEKGTLGDGVIRQGDTLRDSAFHNTGNSAYSIHAYSPRRLGKGYPWPARHLSRIRRSRLVGRPAPRSRAATGTEEVGGGAGVRSR